MALKSEKQIIQEFDKHKSKDYSRKGLDYEFIESNIELQHVAKVLDGIKNYLPKELIGRSSLGGNIKVAINEYVTICEQIDSFNTNQNDPNRNAQQIKNDARKLYDKIFAPDSNSRYSNFLAVYLDSKMDALDLSKAEESVGQLEEIKERANNLVKRIEDSSREKFAHNYSEIFHLEAVRHSSLNLIKNGKEKVYKRGIGFAERYLSIGIVITIILFWLLINDFFIPDTDTVQESIKAIKGKGVENVTYAQALIPFYLKRLIILGLLIFGMRFCFMQFTIHKHLHTVNKHRANTLDSFQFFHDNLKGGDSEIRDQYLIEVAKSIFNLKDTGFIKNDSNESISFIDNFKFFKDQS